MASGSRRDHYDLEQEELRRYGLEHDPYADFAQELELADRYAEQGSLAPGHQPRALARFRLVRGPSLRAATPGDPSRGAGARRAGGARRPRRPAPRRPAGRAPRRRRRRRGRLRPRR
jgi:hypothetical protein